MNTMSVFRGNAIGSSTSRASAMVSGKGCTGIIVDVGDSNARLQKPGREVAGAILITTHREDCVALAGQSADELIHQWP
jgi:hypothetical protein